MSPADSSLSSRKLNLDAIGVALISLLIYTITLCPTVGGGDSGELVTAAAKWGILHPPGYPLYTLLGHLFTYIPYGSVAWRVNFFSALCMSLSSLMLFLSLRRWTENRWAAFLGAGLYAFSPLVWRYSLVAEVFALNNLLVGLFFYVFTRYWFERHYKWLYWGAFLGGLSMSHHHTAALVIGPLGLLTLYLAPKGTLKPAMVVKMLGAIALGLMPYAYLPLAFRAQPELVWGDFSNWQGFWNHVSRADYGTFQLSRYQNDQNHFIKGLLIYLQNLWLEINLYGLAAVAFGLWTLVKGEKKLSPLLIVAALWLIYVGVFFSLGSLSLERSLDYEVSSRFWILPSFWVFTFIGLATAEWMKTYPLKAPAAIAVIVVLVGLQGALHFKAENQSQNFTFQELARSSLKFLPPNSLVLMRGDDDYHSFLYVQSVEGLRPDIISAQRLMLTFDWYKAQIQKRYPQLNFTPGEFRQEDFVYRNFAQFPIFFSTVPPDERASLAHLFILFQHGFLARVVPNSGTFDLGAWVGISEQAFADFRARKPSSLRANSWEAYVHSKYWLNLNQFAGEMLNYGKQYNNRIFVEKSTSLLERQIEFFKDQPDWYLYQNLYSAYQILKAMDPNYQPKLKAEVEDYLQKNMGPPKSGP